MPDIKIESEKRTLELSPFCNKILKCLYMLPEKFTIKYYFGLVLLLIFFYTVSFGMWGHLIHNLTTDSFKFEKIADDITGLTAAHVSMYVHIFFIRNNHKMKKISENMGDFTKFEKPENIETVAKKLNYFAKGFVYYLYISGTLSFLLKIFETCEPDDFSNCGFMISAYLPFDIYSPINRRIYLFFQIYSAFSVACAAFYVSWFILSMSHFLVVYLKHLKVMLLVIPKLKDFQSRKEHVKKCVKYHNRIIYLFQLLHDVSLELMLVHVVGTGLIMSMIIYQLLVVEMQYVSIVHLICWFVSSFVASVFGEMLIQESLSVGWAAYESVPWDGDIETAKSLLFISIRCTRAMYLPGGKFGKIGHVRFLAILKCSYTFLTLIY